MKIFLKYQLTGLLLFVAAVVWSQHKEFEGRIRYEHRFRFQTTELDTIAIKNGFGRQSDFYYKDGNYKWVVHAIPTMTEYFNTKDQTVYFLSITGDSLLRSVDYEFGDSLVSIDLLEKKEMVCGHLCQIAAVVTWVNGDPTQKVQRILYYSPEIPIDPQNFHSFHTYASDKVFARIKSWPLRIEMHMTGAPFILIMEAVEVIAGSLADPEVKMPADKTVADRVNKI